MKFYKLMTVILINIFAIRAHTQTFQEMETRYQAATHATSQTIARVFKGREKVNLICKAIYPATSGVKSGESILPAQLEKDIEKTFGIAIKSGSENIPLSIRNGLPRTLLELLSIDQNGHLVFVKYPSGRTIDTPYITRYVRETESTLILAELEYDLWTNEPNQRAIKNYRLCEIP